MSEFIQIVMLLGTVAAVVLLSIILCRLRRESSDGAEKILRDELRAGRGESQEASRELREELGRGLKDGNDSLTKSLAENSKVQSAQLEGFAKKLEDLSESNRRAIDQVRENLEQRVKELREGNEKKLEEMRKTVDEKLHETLEKRLGESFKLVSERLENVQKGLGEMQTLASGVGDLQLYLIHI